MGIAWFLFTAFVLTFPAVNGVPIKQCKTEIDLMEKNLFCEGEECDKVKSTSPPVVGSNF